MKKMTIVLLVACCLVLGFCSCSRTVEPESTENTETLEGVSYFYAASSDIYEQFLYFADVYGYEIIDTIIKEEENSELGYHVTYQPVECNSSYEEICRYDVYVCDPLSEYEESSGLNTKMETGEYKSIDLKIADSGKSVFTIKERFAVVKTEEDAYNFMTSDRVEYLNVLSLLLEKLEYEIIDISVEDSTYLITFRKTENMCIRTSEDVIDTYVVQECTIQESEAVRAGFLEKGFEILDESVNESEGYLFTARYVQ